MFLKKFKILIYIILFLFLSKTLFPIYSFAFVEDSIYVWSNNSSSLPTVTTSTQEKSQNITQESSR